MGALLCHIWKIREIFLETREKIEFDAQIDGKQTGTNPALWVTMWVWLVQGFVELEKYTYAHSITPVVIFQRRKNRNGHRAYSAMRCLSCHTV